MTITVKVVAHSRAPGVPDLISLQCRYPRFIHAEFMTHRVFSRNASSSRAIPIERMIQDVIDDPAMPVAWGSNKPGMQAGEELTGDLLTFSKMVWDVAKNDAVRHARQLASAGAHKQIVNRLLEPFGHISVVVTATEWSNFFDLRCHPDADPTMRALAEAMQMEVSRGLVNQKGSEWHLPYIGDDDWAWACDEEVDNGTDLFSSLAMISAARCARVSYLNHDGTNPDIEKDLVLAKRLLQSKHMSPFEHQARATGDDGTSLWGNFTGWDQHRKMIEVRSDEA